MSELSLKHVSYHDSFQPEGLARLDAVFLSHLEATDKTLLDGLRVLRNNPGSLSAKEHSALLLTIAPHLESFVSDMFGIDAETEKAANAILNDHPIFEFKKVFVLRFAKRRLSKNEELPSFSELDTWVEAQIGESHDKELAVAELACDYLKDAEKYSDEIEKLTCWCIHAMTDSSEHVFGWTSFNLPKKIDHANLVPLDNGKLTGTPLKKRDGFKLTDNRMTERQVQGEIHYCVYCHKNEGDYCSKGFPVKKNSHDLGFKKNPLDVILTGCPLDEKISEMQWLKARGFTIAPLAVIMIDNPMCPATGHRICNDCMKACIYQKQTPVNVPEVETRILTDALALPWGVEIYDLLTRWNPLRQKQFLAKPYNGLKILVAGMGPAGFTLAHHLLMEGFCVVGVDGLKIEPLPSSLVNKPIESYDELTEQLDERVLAGFGGVAEYGITVRWDKNFLRLIYLTLMRRPHFQLFGGVRFGGTITVEDTKAMGFDHLSVAVGAGLPRALPIPGSLAVGMRQANDFLMSLQLTGAAKESSLASLQLRMPIVVIGGGLTGVDTASEAQAYYIKQVEKHLARYETLSAHIGETALRNTFDPASLIICDEFLEHAKAVRTERERADTLGEAPNFVPLLHAWGGVTITYRRHIQDSPAYVSNHEELHKALEEGVLYRDLLEPKAATTDQYRHVTGLTCHHRRQDDDGRWHVVNDDVQIPARSILVATGAKPNVAYAFEHEGTFLRNGIQYQTFELNNGSLEAVPTAEHCKSDNFGPFTSYENEDFRVSFVGDSHPVFHGNVVKAIASGMRTYPKILEALEDKVGTLGDSAEYQSFSNTLDDAFNATIESIERQNRHTITIRIKAPRAAARFKPGQFYRLQNFETRAVTVGDTLLQMEAIALFATRADIGAGTIDLTVFEKGVSTRLTALFQPGDKVSLMGPTGVRSKMPDGKRIYLVIGNEMAALQALSIGNNIDKSNGSKLYYIGTFSDKNKLTQRSELEAACDAILWGTGTGAKINADRDQDASATGDLCDVFTQFALGDFSNLPFTLSDIDRVTLITDTCTLKKFRELKYGTLSHYFKAGSKVFAGVYSAMQCMLKGVCSQCLQWQVDPITGKRSKAVYACSWQHQPIEMIDIDNIDDRLSQNMMQDTVNNHWLDYLFETKDVKRL